MSAALTDMQTDLRERIEAERRSAEETEKAVNETVRAIVQAAQRGDLSQRINLEGKEGFFKALSQGVNELVEVSENVIKDTVQLLGAMSRGDLTVSIESDYEGLFGKLKADANATVAKLTEVVGNIQATSTSVKTGADELSQGNANLSQRTEELPRGSRL